jgi:two-component system, cell cycle sensor histidine kinase and response regulator CckA
MNPRHDQTAGTRAFMRQFEHHGAMMVLMRPSDGQIVDVNPAAVRFYGYPREVLCGLRIHDINQIPKEEIDRLLPAFLRGKEGQFAYPHRLASGEIRTVEVTAGPVDIEGTVYLLSIVHDISDRHRAERALRESEEKFSKAFHGSPDSININRYADGVYLEINEGFTRMTGYTEADVLGRSSTPGDLGIWVDQADRDRMVAALAEHGETELEARFRRKDGGILLGAMSARLIEIDGVKCVLTITRNVTERRRTEEAQLTAQKLQSLSLLAGGIAHDFNNLLAGILGNISLARMEAQGADAVNSTLLGAERATLRARDLTHQLLTFARGGAPVKRLADVGGLVREAASFASHGSPCACEFDIPPGLWPAQIDEGQLGQVVQNIVINAVQAMPAGGTIRLDARNERLDESNRWSLPAGPYLRVSIADQGSGIPEEQLTRIFDPYFTTKQTGSGLGLATSYSILRNHGGHLGVSSVLGRGSTFTFLVPAEPDRAMPSAAAEWIEVSARGHRVLVMDDQELVRGMAERMLRTLGFSTQGASNGEEALELYRAARSEGRPYQLAILDLTVVGGMGGKATLAALRSMDPTLKVIISSGYSDDPVLADYREHGVSGVLPKPYRLAELKSVLREVLE